MGHTQWQYSVNGGKKENLLKSRPWEMCSSPDCAQCPGAYKAKQSISNMQNEKKLQLYIILYGDGKRWTRRVVTFLHSHVPIMNPHTKIVQQWNKFFVISCLAAIFIDPLFFFLLNADRFRLAYVAPESRVVGAGDLVDDPKKIAFHYLQGYFMLDLFVLLPLPQVMVAVAIPRSLGSSAANYVKNVLRVTVFLQYIPRIIRIMPLLGGQSASGFIFESAWSNFVINLLMFFLAGHVVGSCWYLFGLQRVNQCLRDACAHSSISSCKSFIDCGYGDGIHRFKSIPSWNEWINDSSSSSCFTTSGDFQYGIYEKTVVLTTDYRMLRRYLYALFWGFQQISTLAGNLVPSYFEWEVMFTMGIIGLGLLLFAMLIGNMQNFLLALGRRRLEMQLRRRDVEKWMIRRHLPEELQRRVRQAERFVWVATRGVDEEELLEHLPEDIQRDIRRHFFMFLRKVHIFTLMDEPMLDAVCDKIRQTLFISGSNILYQGGPVEKMIFIVRGKAESIGAYGNKDPLSEGDVCGVELLTRYLEHSSVNKDGGKIRFPGQRVYSTRTVKCLTNVEAFVLRAVDLEEVTKHFARFLRNPRVQGAIRYESPYWRNVAAIRIQVAWRYMKRHSMRIRTPSYHCFNDDPGSLSCVRVST
ncbi:putative cyclic nucleotide-gated ion channel 20, chloroplastic [Apostasia shenzhenica]|uniref:Putative cyclic nucleotide-gated ion channel 20, chloroplastic n=1 Tax=Apostasia shenzhenica TaxID=1088818 RepID=A0A2I0AJB4_9ASPA|nr:putative cyclic nucleotide-gated ion channel 20, chloroplastic [Apostasia shenzhenica]